MHICEKRVRENAIGCNFVKLWWRCHRWAPIVYTRSWIERERELMLNYNSFLFYLSSLFVQLSTRLVHHYHLLRLHHQHHLPPFDRAAVLSLWLFSFHLIRWPILIEAWFAPTNYRLCCLSKYTHTCTHFHIDEEEVKKAFSHKLIQSFSKYIDRAALEIYTRVFRYLISYRKCFAFKYTKFMKKN